MAAAAAVLILLTAGAVQAAPAEKVLGERQVLPNGLVWLFSPQPALPLVTLNLVIKTGVLQEPPGKAGLANLTAGLLASGTAKRSAQQISEEFDFLGARFGAGGGQDFATLSLTVLKKDVPKALEVFRDVLLNPAFKPEEISRLVERLKGRLQSDEDEPGVVAGRAFRKVLYGNFPYWYPIIGTPESLPTITREDIAGFHRTYYRPNNAVLALVGDLTPAEAAALVQDTFGNWEKAALPERDLPPVPREGGCRAVKIDKDITQANIVVGKVGIDRANPDFYALQVMNYIFGGGGFASRLMDNIRDNRGLVYSIHSSFDPGMAPGPFNISLETKNAQGNEAIEQVRRETERIRQRPVTDKELADAKSYLIGSLPMKMDSNAKRAWLMAYVELYGLGLDYPWRYPEIVRGISRQDIQAVAEKYLQPDGWVMVVVGKQDEIKLKLPEGWTVQDKP